MTHRLNDKFYGCLIGGAIGDAMGAPVEGLNYWEIQAQYGILSDLIASPRSNTNRQPGGISDDTALRHYIALAIVRRRGRIRPEDLAETWLEKGNAARFWNFAGE
jgi:ADP-ribosylglycohydrolase